MKPLTLLHLSSPKECVLFLLLVLPASAQIDDCRVPADTDILGLGVRIGLYFQTASTLLIALVKPEEWAGSYISTGLFFLSFFIAVIYSAARNQFPPGAAVNCTWYPVLVMAALAPIDFGLYQPGERFRRLTVYVVCVFTSGCLSVWFWFKGLDIPYEGQCMEPRVFFFYNFSAYGNIRTVFKCFALGFISILLFAFIFGFIPTQKLSSGRNETNVVLESTRSGAEPLPTASRVLPPRASTLAQPTTSPEHVDRFRSPRSTTLPARFPTRKATLDSRLPPSLVRAGTTMVEKGRTAQKKANRLCWFVPSAIAWLSFYIVASEVQLKWNHLDGINAVTTTGQIIPLSLGCLSLIRSLYLLRHVDWLQLIKIPPLTYAEVWHYKLGELEAGRRRN